MNRTKATMDDLPELPFEKVLSYLSLEDRLKARAVSRRWYHQINSFRVKSLCCSDRPSGFIMGKSRWVSGAFVQNFINSTRFEVFFNTFGPTILSSLKHLRLCDLEMNQTAFVQALQSFGQLEELNIIRFNEQHRTSPRQAFELNMPMLQSLQLDYAFGLKWILNAPRLRKITLGPCYPLELDLVHGESVESLITANMDYIKLKQFKNLKFLNASYLLNLDSTFLFGLEQLKEIHLGDIREALKIFKQKRRYNREHLQIYLGGFLLSGPDDPAIRSGFLAHLYFGAIQGVFVDLAKNPSRLADEIPFCNHLYYSTIERAATGSEINILNILKRFTDLDRISVVNREVLDSADAFQRFLDIQKNLKTIELSFSNPQQNLFDRLPEYCAVQKLSIYCAVADLRFLFKLEHLVDLSLYGCPIDGELIRKLFEELQYLSRFGSKHSEVWLSVSSCQSIGRLAKQFQVYFYSKTTTVDDLNSAIQFIECQLRK